MKFPFSRTEETEEAAVRLAAESTMPAGKTAALLAAIAGLCLLAYFSCGLLFLPCGILASALFAVTLLRGGEVVPKIFGAALIFLMWPLTGSLMQALLISFLYLPAGLGFAASFKQRGGFSTAMAASILFTAAFTVPLGVAAMAEFSTSFSMAETLNNFGSAFQNLLFTVFSSVPQTLLTSVFSMAGIGNLAEFTEILYGRIVYTLPATISLFFLLMFSSSYWIFKWICLKSDTPQMRDSYYFMGKFCFIRISLTGAVIYMLACLPTFFNLQYEDAMFFSNLMTIFSYVFAYAGIAFVDYLIYKKTKLHTAVRVLAGLALAALCILPLGISYIVSFVGLADASWNLRRFISAKEGTVL